MKGPATKARDATQKKAEAAKKRVIQETEAEQEARADAEKAEGALEDVVAAGGSREEVEAAFDRAEEAKKAARRAADVRRAAESALSGHTEKLYVARLLAQPEEWASEDVEGTLGRLSEAGAAFAEAIEATEQLMSKHHLLRGRRAQYISRLADLGGSSPSKLPSIPGPLDGVGISEPQFRELAPAARKLAEAVRRENENHEQESAA